MANRLARRFSAMCWVKSGGAINPSQQMMPNCAPPVKVMAPANAITCASTYDSSRQAINEATIVKPRFFGLLVSEKPARDVHDLRKTNPYQSAPSSHWMTAVMITSIKACLESSIDIKIAEQLTTCILESST